MKQDRDCGMPYPTYQMPMYGPMSQNMMPMYGNMPQNNMYMPEAYTTEVGGNIEEQLNNLSKEVHSLERRVRELENLVGAPTNNKYNTSNYQMM